MSTELYFDHVKFFWAHGSEGPSKSSGTTSAVSIQNDTSRGADVSDKFVFLCDGAHRKARQCSGYSVGSSSFLNIDFWLVEVANDIFSGSFSFNVCKSNTSSMPALFANSAFSNSRCFVTHYCNIEVSNSNNKYSTFQTHVSNSARSMTK